MAQFDRRLVRPTHLQVVEALEEAATHANEALPLTPQQTRGQWDDLVGSIRYQPEGFRQWLRSDGDGRIGVLGLAWWTDAVPRRHFRVYAGSSADQCLGLLMIPDRDQPPPVWHMAPDRLFRRGGEWVAVCPCCGAVGPPERLAWAGACCGKCHEAGGPQQQEVRPGTFWAPPKEVKNLTFSPDGQLLFGWGGPSDLIYRWDLRAGQPLPPVRPPVRPIHALAPAGRGGLAAVACGDGMLHFLDLAGDDCAARGAFKLPFPVLRVVVSPDNLTLVLCSTRDAELWARPDVNSPWLPVSRLNQFAQAAAFSPDGDLLALAAVNRLLLFELTERGRLPLLVYDELEWGRWSTTGTANVRKELAFSDSARWLMLVKDSRTHKAEVSYFEVANLRAGKATPREFIVERAVRECVFTPLVEGQKTWRLNPQGAHVECQPVLVHPSPPVLLSSGQPRPLLALAVSPDGQTLATVDALGEVRLWPWRRLVGE